MRDLVLDAIAKGQLDWHCQPIASLDACGWRVQELLLRTPGIDAGRLFEEIAEDADTGRQLDRACVNWLIEQHGVRLKERFFVNLTAGTIDDESFVPWLARTLAQAAINPEQLCLEITEQHAARAKNLTAMVDALHALGCAVALDDVGAGYCNWALIGQLQFDYIKLDGSLCLGCVDSAQLRTVVRCLVECAHALGAKVICEWIESLEQQAILASYGARLFQGKKIGVVARCDHH